MARKATETNDEAGKEQKELLAVHNKETEDEVAKLNRLLAAVLNYLSDDEVEEIDIEYLLKNTQGLREWWDQYRENNRKQIEEEIKQSLSGLSLEELERIHEKIKEKE